jgi:hypothetical protein
MKKYLIIILIVVAAAIVVTFAFIANKGAEAPAENPDALMTSAVGSMVSSFFGTQTALYTPPPHLTFTTTNTFLPTPTFIISTPTFATFTPVYYSATPTKGTVTPTGTLLTPTVDSAALAVGCNNLAFIRDVNVPAGTVLEKNQVFKKTWKIQNTGTCNWTLLYALVPAGGDTLGGEATRISTPVRIWNWSEVSVELQAPNTPGTYTGYWRLSNGQHLPFGATLAVSIVVKDVQPTAVPPTATLPPAYP